MIGHKEKIKLMQSDLMPSEDEVRSDYVFKRFRDSLNLGWAEWDHNIVKSFEEWMNSTRTVTNVFGVVITGSVRELLKLELNDHIEPIDSTVKKFVQRRNEKPQTMEVRHKNNHKQGGLF